LLITNIVITDWYCRIFFRAFHAISCDIDHLFFAAGWDISWHWLSLRH
jgi:hypothetical protein